MLWTFDDMNLLCLAQLSCILKRKKVAMFGFEEEEEERISAVTNEES